MNKKILVWPAQKLKKISKKVEDIPGAQQLIEDLIDTCNVNMGAGLAAPQIGSNDRIVVIKPKVFGIENPSPSSYNPDYMVLINPELENTGDDRKWKEACLSIPGMDANVIRKETTLLKYQDEQGNVHKMIAEWPFSGGIQHECDHLDGKLYIHRLPKTRRGLLVREFFEKQKRQARKLKRFLRGQKA